MTMSYTQKTKSDDIHKYNFFDIRFCFLPNPPLSALKRSFQASKRSISPIINNNEGTTKKHL